MARQAVLLFTKFRDHELYPRDRVFTEYEAWLDILLQAHPVGVDDRSLSERADEWMWNKSQVVRFIDKLVEKRMISKVEEGGVLVSKYEIWFDIPTDNDVKEKELAQTVIDLYNTTFGREIILNEYRQRTIIGRFKEGRKMVPAIGLDQFKAVFLHKKAAWENDKDMAHLLTIETLCARKHFLKYLEAARDAHRRQKAGNRVQGSVLNR